MDITLNLLVNLRLLSPFPRSECNRTTRRQTNSRSVKSQTGQVATNQLAEMFDLNFVVYHRSKCYFGQITPFKLCKYSIGLQLGLMYK